MPRKETPAAPTAAGPRLNLPNFLLALFGLLVVVHSWVQQRADFAFGCTGVGDITTAGGCAEVTSSAYSSFLGVNLLVWGGLFYLVVAALRLGVAATRPPTSHSLRTASLAVVSIGFLFELYLVYVQAFVLEEYCVLCMVSALVVAVLFALHLIERAKGPGPAVLRSAALRPYALGAVALVVLAGAAVLLTPDGSDADVPPTPQTAQAPSSPSASSVQPAAQPTIDGSIPEGCYYDPQLPRLRVFEDLIALGLPYEGAADAPVRALKIFDPNCPHCKTLHGVLEQTIPQVEDDVRVYFQPLALWDQSIPQIQALFIANEQGKFFEMLDGLFAEQEAFAQLHRRASSPEWYPEVSARLVELAGRAGLDREQFRAALEGRKYQALIQQQQQVLADAGVRSVPRFAIEGNVLANTRAGWTPQCIGGLVAQAHEAGAAPAEAEG